MKTEVYIWEELFDEQELEHGQEFVKREAFDEAIAWADRLAESLERTIIAFEQTSDLSETQKYQFISEHKKVLQEFKESE